MELVHLNNAPAKESDLLRFQKDLQAVVDKFMEDHPETYAVTILGSLRLLESNFLQRMP